MSIRSWLDPNAKKSLVMLSSTWKLVRRVMWTSIAVTAATTPALTAAAGDPIPFDSSRIECFGPYIPQLNVIYAQPMPAITWGTGGNDIIIGSSGHDKIFGLGGDDRICAGDGWDEVYGGIDLYPGGGGTDADQIDGGPGVDVLHGGWDNDTMHGGTNFTPPELGYHDFLYGESGDDTLFGESGADVLRGGYDNDYCDGGTGMAGNRPEEDVVDGYCDTAVNDELYEGPFA